MSEYKEFSAWGVHDGMTVCGTMLWITNQRFPNAWNAVRTMQAVDAVGRDPQIKSRISGHVIFDLHDDGPHVDVPIATLWTQDMPIVAGGNVEYLTAISARYAGPDYDYEYKMEYGFTTITSCDNGMAESFGGYMVRDWLELTDDGRLYVVCRRQSWHENFNNREWETSYQRNYCGRPPASAVWVPFKLKKSFADVRRFIGQVKDNAKVVSGVVEAVEV